MQVDGEAVVVAYTVKGWKIVVATHNEVVEVTHAAIEAEDVEIGETGKGGSYIKRYSSPPHISNWSPLHGSTQEVEGGADPLSKYGMLLQ
jgi:hypothetical protein